MYVWCQVEVFWAKAYRLEPRTEAGILAMDGERIEYGAVQGAVMPQALTLMCDAGHLQR